jgi:FAD/FMN-containing dehydrogenase
VNSNRRHFLAGAARTLLAGAAGTGLLAGAGFRAGSAAVPPAARQWAELARRLSGKLLRPGDANFVRFAAPNNLRYAAVLPAGIAQCANAHDVSAAILWAREFGVPLIARSGGHSYGGYSTTSGLMIDLRDLNSMEFDPSTGIATLGGGTRNSHIYSGLRKHGVALTHGRCYGVGVAGLVLGGGVGFNMRAQGVTSDQLIGTDIVTADGHRHALSAKQDSELFWACRGAGGGNFGINTSFRFQTFPVSRLTVYDLTWMHRPDDVFAALMRVLDAAPDSLGCKVSVNAPTAAQRAAGKGITVNLLGQLRGTPAALAEILQSVYRLAHPAGKILETDYWSGQDLLSEVGAPEFFHEQSRFFNEPLSDAAIALVFDRMRRWPGTTKAASFKVFQTGGAMNAIPAGATAFVHRSSSWLSSIGLEWHEHDAAADVQRNLAWQQSFYDACRPYASGGAYQNFIDPALVNSQQAYHGSNLARLEALKAQVDPQRVFRFSEAIPRSPY